MKIQAELIEKYILLLMEYIHLVHSSEIIPQLENASTVFQIGANAVAHIYKITFLITKNVESAGCYTQKGIYCYLEYIEQMNRTNSLHNLDNMDAILYVYDKTLTDIYSPHGIANNSSHEQTMFSNILSMNHPHTEDSTCKSLLENLCSFTKILLWMDNKTITYLQRIDLAHEQLQKWLVLAFDSKFSELRSETADKPSKCGDRSLVGKSPGVRGNTLENREIQPKGFVETSDNAVQKSMTYLTTLQEKGQMDYSDYFVLLETMFKAHKKRAKTQKLLPDSVVREKCMLWTIHFSGKTFSEIIESEFGKSEGWKTIVDVVKWFFV